MGSLRHVAAGMATYLSGTWYPKRRPRGAVHAQLPRISGNPARGFWWMVQVLSCRINLQAASHASRPGSSTMQGKRLSVTQTGTVFASGTELADTVVKLRHPRSRPDRCGTDWPRRSPAPVFDTDKDDVPWLSIHLAPTGRPKGVMNDPGNLQSRCHFAYANGIGQPHRPRQFAVCGSLCLMGGLYHFSDHPRRGCHVIPRFRRVRSGRESESLAQALDNLVFFAAPTMIKRQVAPCRASVMTVTAIKDASSMAAVRCNLPISNEGLAIFGARFVQIYRVRVECP